MRKNFWLFVVIIAACAQSAIAQDDGELRIRKALEGRLVIVKIDLPAIDSGVELILDEKDISYNAANYDKLMKDYGVAIKSQARARITGVRISPKGIEIDLDGGGVPGRDWIVGGFTLVAPAPLPKSDLEIDLERQLSQPELTPSMATYLRDELEFERIRRIAQDDRNRDAFGRVARVRSQYIEENRKKWGSKVIVVVRSTNNSITIRDMAKTLGKYVELIPVEKPSK